MNIDKLINLVTKDIDNNWTTLEKIRYVYLKLGEYLSKDTDFFFSANNKLEEHNLSINEINSIYNNLEGRKVGENNYAVICRSASYILHKIYESLGIESRLINTINDVTKVNINGEETEINHWLLVVKDNDKSYFMLLAADLPYIKENMKVHHFAAKIPYKKKNSDGVEEQLYDGEEIVPSLLTEEETRKIDEKIGYLKYYYKYDDNKRKQDNWYLQYNDASFQMIRENMKNNRLYYSILAKETDFYKSLYTFTGDNNRTISFEDVYLNELSENEKKEWITILCFKVNQLLKQLYDIDVDTKSFIENFNYQNWIESICNKLHKTDDFSYKKWSKEVKKEEIFSEKDHNNCVAILDKTNALVNFMMGNNNGNFNELLSGLSYHFIDKKYLYEDSQINNFTSNFYIAYKFSKLFPKLFSANEIITDFNKRDYSEQIVLIKEIINLMFPELNKNNSNIKDYDDKYTPVQNRIQTYTIKNKELYDYALVFNVIGNYGESDIYFYYNPKTNEFSAANILDIYQNYIIVSERFKSKIEEFDENNNIKRK